MFLEGTMDTIIIIIIIIIIIKGSSKYFYILWTVARDTYTWEWPTRCPLFPVNLFQLNYLYITFIGRLMRSIV